MAKINQWNCRGLRANSEEHELLMKNYEPVAICLQELQVSDSYILDNNLHIMLIELPHIPTGHRPHGGARVLIREDLPYSVIPLNTTLRAIAWGVLTFQPLTLCSLCLPPSSSW